MKHAYVMLVSLLENNRNEHINLFYFHYDLDDTSIHKFKRFFNKYDVTVNFIRCDFRRIEGLKSGRYFTEAAYLRVLSPDLLPKAVKRVLYLDPDIIVTTSLSELYNTDLGDCYFGAVEDVDSGEDKYNTLNIPAEYGYFNSGVLLIDMERFRKHRISTQVMRYASAHPDKIQCADQDPLNVVLYDKRFSLHPRWNLQILPFARHRARPQSLYTEFQDAVSQPAVIHYLGAIKPWHYLCDHPRKELYWHYVRKTPYRFSEPLKYWYRYILWKPKNIAGSVLRGLILHSPAAVRRLVPQALKHRLRN
jgi:lipopolysaccharide biosynthesis glycosyltransferase